MVEWSVEVFECGVRGDGCCWVYDDDGEVAIARGFRGGR